MILDTGRLAAALLGGCVLSLLMFGGLWWTLRRLPASRRPWLFALVSFWVRLIVVAIGFYLICAGDWRRAVASLVGFWMGRTLLVHRFASPSRPRTPEGA